jgi:protoheme IX farnesyltransferase
MLVFLWQFPHFMAIAWLHRREYADAGMSMATVVEPTGRNAGVQAVLTALSLILVSLVPLLLMMSSSIVYLFGSFTLGVGQLICAIRFLVDRTDVTARMLLRASLIYLPLQLALVTLLTLALI